MNEKTERGGEKRSFVFDKNRTVTIDRQYSEKEKRLHTHTHTHTYKQIRIQYVTS
jgi:hypothetical protein